MLSFSYKATSVSFDIFFGKPIESKNKGIKNINVTFFEFKCLDKMMVSVKKLMAKIKE